MFNSVSAFEPIKMVQHQNHPTPRVSVVAAVYASRT